MAGRGKFDEDPDHLDALTPVKDPDEPDAATVDTAPVEVTDGTVESPPAYPDIPVAADPERIKVLADLIDSRPVAEPDYTNGAAKGTDKVDFIRGTDTIMYEGSPSATGLSDMTTENHVDADDRDDADDADDDPDDTDDPEDPEEGEAARSLSADADLDAVLVVEAPAVGESSPLAVEEDVASVDDLDLEG